MKHSFNLRRIADKAAPKGSNPVTFYNRLTVAFKGAYGEMTDKELAAVEKVIKEESDDAITFVQKLRESRKASEKKEGAK